jgi:hypothetical protein
MKKIKIFFLKIMKCIEEGQTARAKRMISYYYQGYRGWE